MTGPADETGIRVRVYRDELEGTIIDAGPDSVLGVQPVGVVDAVQVWVDPLDPARFVRVTCADVSESGWFLDELLGHGAFAAISAASRVPDAAATVRPTQVARDIGRLGLLLWLEDCSPLPLPQGLLDAEIASAVRAFPGATVAAEVHVRCRAAMPAVLELATELTDGSVQPSAGLAKAAYLVAGTLLGSGSPDEEQARTLIRLAAAARSAGAAIAAGGDIDTTLLALFESAAAAIDWGGSWTPASAIERRFSVDWRLVPRGVLDTREGTIRVGDAEGHGLAVSVSATPGADEVPLFARILPADGADPIAVTPLRLDAPTTSYRGIVPVDALSDGDRVDVFSASATVAPLRGSDAQRQAAALRCAARAYGAMRLAMSASPGQAPVLWRSAAGDWTEWLADHAATNAATAARDRDVVLGALARCQRNLGLPAARRTAARRTDPGTEPVWADPAGALSLAEGQLLGLV